MSASNTDVVLDVEHLTVSFPTSKGVSTVVEDP
jgi:hypothetical protein